jgi:ABC-type multidrug transport system fused ATPase/permease subunit
MMDSIDAILDRPPLFVLFAVMVLLFILLYEVGFRLGRRHAARQSEDATQISTIMAGVLGLLALMLAFTFNMANARFDARKQALLSEANAIGTTWLRSRMLPPPHPEAIEALLERYVGARFEATRADSPAELSHWIAASEALQEQLWQQAVELGREQPRSVPVGLFAESLNQVIDLHEERVAFALRYRIAGAVWLTLYLLAFSSVALAGTHAGTRGKRILPVAGLLVLTLSATMTLIVDLDRVKQTLFSVNQSPLIELQDQLAHASAAAKHRID